jgi:two-component system, NarL family, sensor kinase
MKSLLFLILFSCTFFGIYGTEVDQILQLREQLVHTQEDSVKLKFLAEICDYYRNRDTVELKGYLTNMIRLADSAPAGYTKADAYLMAGMCYNDKDFFKAIEYYRKAKEYFSRIRGKLGEIGMANVLRCWGLVYHYNGDLATAIKMYLEAKRTYVKYNDYKRLVNIFSKLGDAYGQLFQTEKARFYNKQAIDYAKKTNDAFSLANGYIAYASNLLDDKNFAEAKLYYLKARSIGKSLNNYYVVSVVSYDMAYLYGLQKNYWMALKEYNEAYKIAQKTGILYDQCDVLYKLGLTYYRLKDYDNSTAKLLKGLELGKTIKSRSLQRNIYETLASVEEKEENFKKANIYLNKNIDLIYEVFTEEDQKQVNFLNARYENERKENDIIQLQQERNIQKLRLRQRNQINMALAALVIVIICGGYFIVKYLRNKQKLAQQEAELQKQKVDGLEKEKQLVEAKSLLQGETFERMRIARDLHDGLGGLLSGVKLSLNGIRGNAIITEDNIDSFNRAMQLLDTSITELRRVAHNMMPETLIKYGLKAALNDFTESLTSGIDVAVNFRYYGTERRLDNKMEIVLYRIAQELVNNALKHSKATEIMVQIIQENDRINLTVQDNGKGFDTSKLNEKSGHGLQNIKTRIASFEGRFELFSEKDKGTEAIVEFKL